MAAHYENTTERVKAALYWENVQMVTQEVRFEEPVDIFDVLPGNEDIEPDAVTAQEMLAEIINDWMAGLTPNARHVLARMYGLNGCKTDTMDVIGQELGMTGKGVCWTRRVAIKNLRERLSKAGLTAGDFL